MKSRLFCGALAGALTLGMSVAATAQPLQTERLQMRSLEQERVYGWELMSDQERRQHQMHLRQAETVEERERIRRENHERMLERARRMGVTLPAAPGPHRRGMGGGRRGGRF